MPVIDLSANYVHEALGGLKAGTVRMILQSARSSRTTA
jgi:hypothetical protein